MELQVVTRNVVSQGEISSSSFGLSLEDEAHLINVLRSTLYSNKELAVLREYGTNAWDAHVEAGIPDRPIKVTLPTDLSPSLVIRDYGFGMSEATIYGIYAQYGKSTKRNSNEPVGFMGIGSKSAFAYTDTFTITSFYGGTKTVYLAVIDATNIGKLSKVHEEPCAISNTGIEITVPVNPEDVASFHNEANYLFPFFYPTPEINIPIAPRRIEDRNHGFLDRKIDLVEDKDDDADRPKTPVAKADAELADLRWVAVMGPVPYRLNFKRMLSDLKALGIEDLVGVIGGGLYFDIGEININASREEVEYNPRTRAAVVAKMRLLFDELLGDLTRTVEDPLVSDWVKRVTVLSFYSKLGLPISEKFSFWASPSIQLPMPTPVRDGDGNSTDKMDQVPFKVSAYNWKRSRWGESTTEVSTRLTECVDVPVVPNLRFVIRDTDKSLAGYNLTRQDRVVAPTSSMEVMEAGFAAFIAKNSLAGASIVRMSDLPHRADAKDGLARAPGTGKKASIKHTETYFVLIEGTLKTQMPLSDNWDVVERVAKKSDVYVILSHFVPFGEWARRRYGQSNHASFYTVAMNDRRVLRMLGVDFPTIYGVKTTSKNPIHDGDVKGTPYAVWRKAQFEAGLEQQPHILRWVEDYYWSILWGRSNNCSSGHVNSVRKTLQAKFPVDHPLRQLFDLQAAATARIQALSGQDQETVRLLAQWRADSSSPVDKTLFWRDDPFCQIPSTAEGQKAVDAVLARYPLLNSANRGPSFDILSGGPRDAWFAYIQLMDHAYTRMSNP